MTNPKNKHEHVRTKSNASLALDESSILVKGAVARESSVVDKLLNTRFAILSVDVFATFRKETDESPSKVWSVTKDVVVSEVAGSEFHLRHAGTSTFWAVARGAYDTKKMWAFTVTWSSVLSTDKLTLAFETEARAKEWHAGFERAIQTQASKPRTTSTQPGRPEMSADASGGQGSRGRSRTTTLTSTSTSASSQEDGVELVQSLSTDSATHETEDTSHTKRSWASLLHINGISVYVEELDEDGGGGALMVSAVVRAPPSDVTSHLVRVRKTEGLAIFAGARTLKVVDSHTHVIGQTWTGSGVLGRVTAPREIVLLRTWRKDPDGTYIVGIELLVFLLSRSCSCSCS